MSPSETSISLVLSSRFRSLHPTALNLQSIIAVNEDQQSPTIHLLHLLHAAGYYDGNSNRIERTDIEDEFVVNENLSMEFIAAATSCLNFARDRPDILVFVPRGDIQVVTENGTPFLFKNAHETDRKMRSFAEKRPLIR